MCQKGANFQRSTTVPHSQNAQIIPNRPIIRRIPHNSAHVGLLFHSVLSGVKKEWNKYSGLARLESQAWHRPCNCKSISTILICCNEGIALHLWKHTTCKPTRTTLLLTCGCVAVRQAFVSTKNHVQVSCTGLQFFRSIKLALRPKQSPLFATVLPGLPLSHLSARCWSFARSRHRIRWLIPDEHILRHVLEVLVSNR